MTLRAQCQYVYLLGEDLEQTLSILLAQFSVLCEYHMWPFRPQGAGCIDCSTSTSKSATLDQMDKFPSDTLVPLSSKALKLLKMPCQHIVPTISFNLLTCR